MTENARTETELEFWQRKAQERALRIAELEGLLANAILKFLRETVRQLEEEDDEGTD